ncbi:hypothetical protein EYC80_005196 [Monilinia laxa]|uniref:Uncharacterized protein n=1 Tax=Monilinia laxa TaxID=61186 RepID=A0A5N6KJ48_MONLA|nr:hypothetical protein EYC80_005196 [Monilinia laxa]
MMLDHSAASLYFLVGAKWMGSGGKCEGGGVRYGYDEYDRWPRSLELVKVKGSNMWRKNMDEDEGEGGGEEEGEEEEGEEEEGGGGGGGGKEKEDLSL